MNRSVMTIGIAFLIAALSLRPAIGLAEAVVSIQGLKVEHTTTPLGIDVKAPHISWQMLAPAGARGYAQTAYRIAVTDPGGNVVWDTKKRVSGESLNIEYAGNALRAATRYTVSVTVWDQTGKSTTANSWFETGLMNPDPSLSAWEGADWIGGGSEDLVLYSHYLPLFNLNFTVSIAEGSTHAGFILAANDSRLMDKNKNFYQLENKRNQSYFKIELDVSGVDERTGGKAKLNIYRAGYTDRDNASQPVKSFEIKSEVLNAGNRYQAHTVAIHDEFGELSLTLDGSEQFFVEEPKPADQNGPPRFPFGGGRNRGAVVSLNPMGSGGDVLSFGMLCDIGFALDTGQQATFSNVTVSNTMRPGNTLFREDLGRPAYDGIFKRYAINAQSGLRIAHGAYEVSGGRTGAFIVADPSHNAMPMLRTSFGVADRQVAGARLYVTARGIYEIYLNGRRVGDDYYNPGLTQYNVTHLYQTYDVTSMVHSGRNALGAMLGEGWWSGLLSFGNIWNHFGDRQSLLAKLVITYKDGSRDVVTTNEKDWKYFGHGPVVYSSLDMGEVYDATRDAAVDGWSTAAYDDRAWKPAVRVPLAGTANIGASTDFRGAVTDFNYDRLALIGQIGNNAGIYKTLTAKSVKEARKGVYVYNFGQNFVGVPKVILRKGRAGQKITLRVSEVLYPAMTESGKNVGMIMTENYRAALSQDTYVMKNGMQVFQPRFTSHGFQYLEITGIDKPLPLEDVQGLSISSVRAVTASYESSNPRVNQLWSNLVWSNVDNFLTIPTDCPQRNERMGWSGDISIFSRTATYVSDASQFLRRHLFAMRDVQTAQGKFTDIAPVGGGFGGVLWGSAGMTIPWEIYQQYDDVSVLAEHYDSMKAYIRWLASTIDKDTGLSSDAQLGDWLGPQNNKLGSAFLATAYHVFDLEIMARVAEVLNQKRDAAKYWSEYKQRKNFFNAAFVSADKKTLAYIGGDNRPGSRGQNAPKPTMRLADTQSSYAVGLALHAFSDENIPYMAKNLKAAIERENRDDTGVMRPAYSLMTGFIGTAWISKALSDNGCSDLAYKVLQGDKYPSWLYAVRQGATTIWERLNGFTEENGFGGNNSMNSFNHYSFGAVGQWMMAYSLGIQRDAPGFRQFILQPEPDPTGEMNWAKGYYDSMYGRIESGWRLENGSLEYRATVPANTTATLYLPTSSARSVRESGTPTAKANGIRLERYENGKAVYKLKSGSYKFAAQQ